MMGWMLAAFLGTSLVAALLSLRTAAREFNAVDSALLRTLTDLYAARDAHAKELALKDSAIQALLDSRAELQRDLFSLGIHERVAPQAGITTH